MLLRTSPSVLQQAPLSTVGLPHNAGGSAVGSSAEAASESRQPNTIAIPVIRILNLPKSPRTRIAGLSSGMAEIPAPQTGGIHHRSYAALQELSATYWIEMRREQEIVYITPY